MALRLVNFGSKISRINCFPLRSNSPFIFKSNLISNNYNNKNIYNYNKIIFIQKANYSINNNEDKEDEEKRMRRIKQQKDFMEQQLLVKWLKEQQEKEKEKEGKQEQGDNSVLGIMEVIIGAFLGLCVLTFFIQDVANYKKEKELNIREEKAPITGRSRHMAGKPKFELEEEISAKIDEQYLAMLKSYSDNDNLFSPDSVYTILCRRVLNKIIDANPEVQDYKWDVNVCTSVSPNALVFPNGRMLVNIGMLLLLENEDELAAILAHEVAHIFARHSAEVRMGLGKNYHRDQILETEADHIGLILMTRACYDPNQAPGIFKKIEALEKEFEEKGHDALPPTKADIERAKLSHPTNLQRFQNLTKLVPKAEQEYQNSKCAYEPNEHVVTPQFWDHMSQTRESIHNKVKQGILQKKENEKLMVDRIAEEGLEEGAEFSPEKEKELVDDVLLIDDDDEKYRRKSSV